MDKVPDSEMVAELQAKAREEPIASFLKTELRELAPGYARVAMKVRPEHMNFNGLLFGGIIMSVADQSFAYATNALVRHSVALQFNIHFIAAAAVGGELIAECRVPGAKKWPAGRYLRDDSDHPAGEAYCPGYGDDHSGRVEVATSRLAFDRTISLVID